MHIMLYVIKSCTCIIVLFQWRYIATKIIYIICTTAVTLRRHTILRRVFVFNSFFFLYKTKPTVLHTISPSVFGCALHGRVMYALDTNNIHYYYYYYYWYAVNYIVMYLSKIRVGNSIFHSVHSYRVYLQSLQQSVQCRKFLRVLYMLLLYY